jgi:regulator of RNase E activity RraA
MIMDKKIEYLKSIDTGVISDAMGLLGIEGWTGNIFPTSKDFKIAGKAFTGLFTAPVSNNEKTYAAYDVIDMCEPGDVLIFAGAPEGRIFGGNLAAFALNKGLEAVVLDGGTRDVSEIEEKIPLFCRKPVIRPTENRYKLTQIKVSVNCDGAMVSPGDIVVGDRDGIIVIPVSRLDDVIYQCEMIAGVESEMSAALKKKAPVDELKAIIKKKKILRT